MTISDKCKIILFTYTINKSTTYFELYLFCADGVWFMKRLLIKENEKYYFILLIVQRSYCFYYFLVLNQNDLF